MMLSTRFCLGALALGTTLVLLGGCGGGGGTTTAGPPNTIDTGGNQVPDLIFSGPPQYGGHQDPTPPPVPVGTGTGGTTPPTTPFIYKNIFAVPITSNGQGKVVATTLTANGDRLGFLPGQKVAMVVVNTNPIFLDAHYDTSLQRTTDPGDPAYSITADLVARGTSSMASFDKIQQATRDSLGRDDAYNGLISQNGPVSPSLIYEREAQARGETPYAVVPPIKQASIIQKGDIRSFVNVPPTIPPPPIVAGPMAPDRPVGGLSYPFEYTTSQRGRLVTIGAHCLIFLSTEINQGKPDTIKYTEARLAEVAREFDTHIFPTTQDAFGPVDNYLDGNIFRDIDPSIVLTGDDFDQGTPPKLLKELPGTVDTSISEEHKIIIFLFKSNNGGVSFYTGGLSQASRQKLIAEGRTADLAKFGTEGSTLYIDANNFDTTDQSWITAGSVMAHEFQHKVYHDNGLPERDTDPDSSNFLWFNEGLSQMSIHVNGYTTNSGRIVPWAINGQLTDYLSSINQTPIPADGSPRINVLAQYGGGFLFFLYLYEHYDPGVGKRIYAAAKAGEKDYIKLAEAGAQQTLVDPGPDGQVGTTDDVRSTFHDSFQELYTKYTLANFIDGIYEANNNALFDPRFHYNTIDLRGTVNLANGTVVLPGVRTGVYPQGGTYPVTDIHRIVRPWCMDYIVFTNGDTRDLSLTVYTDPFMKMFMLPVNYDATQNAAGIVDGVTIPIN